MDFLCSSCEDELCYLITEHGRRIHQNPAGPASVGHTIQISTLTQMTARNCPTAAMVLKTYQTARGEVRLNSTVHERVS